jgi:hypothetical protein
LQEFEAAQVDSELAGGAEAQGLFFGGDFAEPGDAMLGTDGRFLELADEFCERGTVGGLGEGRRLEVLGGEKIVLDLKTAVINNGSIRGRDRI